MSSYATCADLLADADPVLVAQLTGTDEPDEDKITRALENASGEIDSFLASRYPVPLADPPVVLRKYAVDIALYEMQKLRQLGDLEDSRQRYEDALRFLMRVNEGKLNLGPAPSEGEAVPVPNGIAFHAPPRIMTGMGDY